MTKPLRGHPFPKGAFHGLAELDRSSFSVCHWASLVRYAHHSSPPCESSTPPDSYSKRKSPLSRVGFFRLGLALPCHSMEDPTHRVTSGIGYLHKKQVTTHPWCNVHGSIHAAGSSFSECHWHSSLASLTTHHPHVRAAHPPCLAVKQSYSKRKGYPFGWPFFRLCSKQNVT